MTPPPLVGRAAFLLGFAGLLPQMAAVAWIATLRWSSPIGAGLGAMAALIYGGAILSFLGGIWWGFAMQRQQGQGRLAALAVLPSLFVVALPLLLFVVPDAMAGSLLIALGSATLLTLLVDRRLVAAGEAPANWMRLRVPLSLGLGALTIAGGLLSR